jgi:hypothetical protein
MKHKGVGQFNVLHLRRHEFGNELREAQNKLHNPADIRENRLKFGVTALILVDLIIQNLNLKLTESFFNERGRLQRREFIIRVHVIAAVDVVVFDILEDQAVIRGVVHRFDVLVVSVEVGVVHSHLIGKKRLGERIGLVVVVYGVTREKIFEVKIQIRQVEFNFVSGKAEIVILRGVSALCDV